MCSTKTDSNLTGRFQQEMADPFSEVEDDSDEESHSKQEDFSSLECKENVTGKHHCVILGKPLHVAILFC